MGLACIERDDRDVDEREQLSTRRPACYIATPARFPTTLQRARGLTRFLENARFLARNCSPTSLTQALRRGVYTHIVYYGHAVDDGATLKPLKEITVNQMTDALSGTSVVHIDILGCSSASFAAKLVLSVPKLTAGSFLRKRLDDIEVDMATMQLKKLVIERQPLHHFRPSKP